MALKYLENSYVTLNEANEYFADRYGAEVWVSLDNNAKDDLLVTATRTLDQEVWTGVAVSTSQSLSWPRSGTYYEPKQGYVIELPEDSIPQRIKEATFELALHYINSPEALTSSSTVDSLKVGSIELTKIRSSAKAPGKARDSYKLLLANSGSAAVWRAW